MRNRINALVALAGSRDKLARLLGVSTQTVHRWARGENAPNSKPMLDRLAEVERKLTKPA